MTYLPNNLGSFKSAELDLFGGATIPSTSLIGLEAILPKPCASCGSNVVVMGSSAGPHWARLNCATCNAYRGWASAEACRFINEIINSFGRPAEAIIVRDKFITGISSCAPGARP